MSGIGAWIWGTSQLDDAVDKATSELLPSGSEDIALNLEICDQIRSKSVPAKDAMRALKRRLNHKNPNVQLLALSLTDICVKNGGDLFLAEIASRDFMDNLISILKIPALNIEVKNIILRLIQNWSVAFEGKPALNYVGQVYKTLTNEGFKFPPKDPALANTAMVDTQTAPDWIDSDVCLRCRTAFSFTNRKHHCRNCGQVFDQACSSKSMALPHFGITQEVRVCDGCYSKLTRKADKVNKEHRHSTSDNRHRSARELADAELQRAIQLSLQEVNGANGSARPGYVPSQPSPSKWQISEPPIIDRTTYPDRRTVAEDDDDDPELKAAIEASLREANAPKPSAPVIDVGRAEPAYSYGENGSQHHQASTPQPSLPSIPNYDLGPLEADAILTFNQTVEQVQAQGGRDLSRYPAVTELYDKASNLRPKLALSLDDAGRKEEILSEMHSKLSQAVKLYDQILTQQVSQPRWRSPVTATPAPYQPTTSAYHTGFNLVNNYGQWSSQLQPQPTGSQVLTEYQAQGPNSNQAYDHQTQYSASPRLDSSQPQWQQQQSFVPAAIPYAPTPVPTAPQLSPSVSSAPVSHSPQFAPLSQYQPYGHNTPSSSQTLPPVTLNHQQTSQLSSIQSPPVIPSSVPQSPPPTPAQYAQHAPPPDPQFSLARNNTVTYASSPTNSQLGLSNTVSSYAPSHLNQQRYGQYQQQQPRKAVASPPPPPQSTLPQFPVAPTTVPQFAQTYGSSIPSGIEHKEERKEALLIDL